MAFKFNWPHFDDNFHTNAGIRLEEALNRGKKPTNICDTIRVREIHMGSRPPELDILEIGELSKERFRGIFKFVYSGDAFVVLQTKVQANPLNLGAVRPPGRRSGLFRELHPDTQAAAPLIVPMELRLSHVRLRGIFVLIVSQVRGITLSFKNDPLESILVSSTFDSVESVRGFLQREIEERMREIFRDELPALVHQFSLQKIKEFGDGSVFARGLDSSAFPSRSSSPSAPAKPGPDDQHANAVRYFLKDNVLHRTCSLHDSTPVHVNVRPAGLASIARHIPLVSEIFPATCADKTAGLESLLHCEHPHQSRQRLFRGSEALEPDELRSELSLPIQTTRPSRHSRSALMPLARKLHLLQALNSSTSPFSSGVADANRQVIIRTLHRRHSSAGDLRNK